MVFFSRARLGKMLYVATRVPKKKEGKEGKGKEGEKKEGKEERLRLSQICAYSCSVIFTSSMRVTTSPPLSSVHFGHFFMDHGTMPSMRLVVEP